MDIIKEFNNYDKEKLIKLVKIYINNPYLDLKNTIYLFEQGLSEYERLVKYSTDKGKLVYIYGKTIEEIRYYNFCKENISENHNILNLTAIKENFTKATGIAIKTNTEVDIDKKDSFIKDNILYISDLISENKQILLILNEYIDIISKVYSNIGSIQLAKMMISHYVNNTDIDLPLLVYKSFDIERILVFTLAFEMHYRVMFVFVNRIVKLNDILNINLGKESEYNYLDEEILKIKNDIKNDNMPNYPYYYL